MSGAEPVRVLHLVCQGRRAPGGERPCDPDAELLACAAVRRALPGHEQGLCLIGGNALERRAAEVGLPATDRIAPPLGESRRAGFGLRALLADRDQPDVVHCWGPDALRLARGIAGPALCATFLGAPERAPGTGRRTSIGVCADAAEWAAALGADAHALVKVPVPRHAGAGEPPAGAGVREALGVGPGTALVVLIGGAPGEADALRLVFLLGLLWVAGFSAAFVVPDTAARLGRALRYHAMSGWRSRLIVSDRPPMDLLAGADLAVWAAPPWAECAGVGPTPAAGVLIGAAVRAGVPVVTPRCGIVEALLPPRVHGACLAFNASPSELARVMLALLSDSGLRRRTADALRAAPPAPDPDPFARAVEAQWLAASGRGPAADAQRGRGAAYARP